MISSTNAQLLHVCSYINGCLPLDYNIEFENDNLFEDEVYLLIQDLVGADCWAITIKTLDNKTIVLMSAYLIPNDINFNFDNKFSFIKNFRTKVIEDPNELLQFLTPDDTLQIWMFGQDGFRVEFSNIKSNIKDNKDIVVKFYGTETCIYKQFN